MVDNIVEEHHITLPRDLPSGNVIAVDVDVDIYMRDYAESFYEWVNGVLVKMSPVSGQHDGITNYIRNLMDAYFSLRKFGTTRAAPFVMRIDNINSRREPDLQVILNSNPGTLNDTYMDGASDICIEVVSPSNEGTDYGDKFREYELGGVREYWLIDPRRQEVRFHRLSEAGLYKSILPTDGIYSTPLLPDFKLIIDILWQDELPDFYSIADAVKAMLKTS